jgi:hypothetical protein
MKTLSLEKKEAIQYATAVGMLVAGLALTVAGFVVAPLGVISDSVLYVLAQCLIYAGSIFGIGLYMNTKIDVLKRQIQKGASDAQD